MLNYKFYIDKYDWDVEVYYYITKYDVKNICNKLRKLDCEYNSFIDIYDNITENKLNTGLTYSSYKHKSSIIIVSKTSTPSEFINSLTHELYHLVTHIVDYYNIDFISEEAAYLQGSTAQIIYNHSKDFFCSCKHKN